MPDFCRSCRAEIRWALSYRDKPMPLNLDPVDDGEWALAASHVPGGHPRVVYIPPDRRGDYKGSLYVPHWATCPNADQHRRSRGRSPDAA